MEAKFKKQINSKVFFFQNYSGVSNYLPARGLPGHCPLRNVVAWAQMGIAH